MTYRKKQILLTAVMTALLCALLAACGSEQNVGGNTAIAGTWEMTDISTGVKQMSAEDYKKSAGVSKAPVLVFEKDGAVTLEVDGDSGSGTWTEENGNYSITYRTEGEDHTQAVEMDGSKLTMEQNGYTLTYERQ